ncbi:helix-turn-helix domain-containing protein [Streptomyces swartbergensis]|uniref:helix-turn-helix domain-containing protein n=1 Tax=Streptomyces swartbergensis TaxID=487165 RepID=UPI003CC6585F
MGAFLKARRAQLSPGEVGLASRGEPRRVLGLRREEVARLAVISTDYYTRLEQGRVQASAAVLDALSQVLRLDGDQREYILTLAGKTALPAVGRGARQEVEPQMLYLLNGFTLTAGFVIEGSRTAARRVDRRTR